MFSGFQMVGLGKAKGTAIARSPFCGLQQVN